MLQDATEWATLAPELAMSNEDNELPAGSPEDDQERTRTCQPQLKTRLVCASGQWQLSQKHKCDAGLTCWFEAQFSGATLSQQETHRACVCVLQT